MKLNERRAKFVYDAARLAAIAAEAPVVPVPWDEREHGFKAQFRDVIERQCGVERYPSAEAAHNGWWQKYIEMGWEYGVYDREAKTHPDMVAYDLLGERERDKDEVWIALCDIAREWIYDIPPCDDDDDGCTS